jgi:hypothetical protein
MGYFDGMTKALLRSGSDGQLYHVPLGKFGAIYLIPDEAASKRLQARWRAFFITLFAIMLAAVWYTQGNWRVILLAPVAGLLAIPFALWAAHDLPRATIAYSDLPKLTRSDALTAYSQATGRRTLGVVLVISVLMTLLGLLVAILQNTLALWASAGFFALCSFSLYRAFRRAG